MSSENPAMPTLKLVQVLTGHRGRVWNISWHPEGNLLTSCGEDKIIRIWGTEGGVEGKWVVKTSLTDGHERTIREVTWSPCGNYLASASFDATTAIWDKKSGQFECNATLEGHENEVKSVSWAKSGQLMATCSRDKTVWVWEVAEEDEYECAAVLNAHTQDVKKVIWHPNDELLASASYDNTIKMFREDPADQEWTCVATLSSHTSTVWSIAFNKTGTRLASCSDDGTVKIWQVYLPGNQEGIATPDGTPVWKCVSTIAGMHSRCVYDVAWCHQTGLIATASADDVVRIFQESLDSDPNQPNFDLVASSSTNGHKQDVNCVAWHPTVAGLLASCSDDGEIRLWKFLEGTS
ncbi:probable cytosolic iron-sulfur protein assembly protein Ciao1 [Thrips palmi]|uniref:Probable cytosolic iron-sulfur protein assembly protein Ciao1 n=1 Tax=Thrips palmi TaxID=161013 RepID=A0A6P8Z173_THRPL|nr:probable cytosolic iron-sulfur protein assembly protein Ciao1 [Thrips palmi]